MKTREEAKALLDLVERCRIHASEAIATILLIMQDREENGATRLSAAREILDRGFGKAPQQVSVAGTKDSDPILVDMKIDPDTAALLDKLAARLSGGEGSA